MQAIIGLLFGMAMVLSFLVVAWVGVVYARFWVEGRRYLKKTNPQVPYWRIFLLGVYDDNVTADESDEYWISYSERIKKSLRGPGIAFLGVIVLIAIMVIVAVISERLGVEI